MWADAAQAAARDAGIDPGLLAHAGAVLVTDCMSWRYDDAPGRLAGRIGAPDARLIAGTPSGTSGQTLVDQANALVRSGAADLVLVAGGEAMATRRHYRLLGETPPWHHAHPDGPAPAFDLQAHQHPAEAAVGLLDGIGAVYGFAMRDVARRAHLGIAPDVYRALLGETMAGMTRVAARNPDAWFPVERTPAALITPSADNRMIAYPYTKNMVAIIDVDISGAILIASERWAEAHGVATTKRIYQWASCHAEDPAYIAVRPELWRSPAMAAAAGAVLDAADLTIERIDHLDLYSCFASAVNFARDALGVTDRPGDTVTCTGGLPYAGGPASSYMLTSIVKMVERLRAEPGSRGMVSGVGMMMSHHVFALYSTDPPPAGLIQPDAAAVQRALAQIPELPIEDGYGGPATIIAYTVVHDRDGAASHGIAICDLPGGARTYVRILDAALLARAEAEEFVGCTVDITAGERIGTIVSAAEQKG